MAEGACLESVYTATYRRFESCPLRCLGDFCGGVPEWPNGAVSKTAMRNTLSYASGVCDAAHHIRFAAPNPSSVSVLFLL